MQVPEHAEFDAERFINYMEENSDSSTLEKCCWPQIVGMNTDLNEREDRERSEGQLRKKARLLQDELFVPYPHLDADTVLSHCSDFKFERSALQDLVESRGHILLISVKCHPECAGAGIEYCWGKLKFEFRKRNHQKEKRKSGQELNRLLLQFINDSSILPIHRIWKFARRSRDYMRLYMNHHLNVATSSESKDLTHGVLERMKQEYKTHRNILEIERTFIMDT